jgi:pimeloyl-ACP methyl ester carboxylesterase
MTQQPSVNSVGDGHAAPFVVESLKSKSWLVGIAIATLVFPFRASAFVVKWVGLILLTWLSLALLFGGAAWLVRPPNEPIPGTIDPKAHSLALSPADLRAKPHWLLSARAQYFTAEKVAKMAYWEVGSAPGYTGPDVYYLHGGPGDVLDINELSSAITMAGPARVFVIQQVGTGASSSVPSELQTVANQVRWITAMIVVKSTRPVIIYGSSWGSMLGTRIIAARPELVAGMLATGPSYPVNLAGKVKDEADADRLLAENPLKPVRLPVIGTSKFIVADVRRSDEADKAAARKNTNEKVCPENIICRSAAYVDRTPSIVSNRKTLWQRIDRIWPALARRLIDSATFLAWSQERRYQATNRPLSDSSWQTPLVLSERAKSVPIIAIRGVNDSVDRGLVLLYGRDFDNFELIELPNLGHREDLSSCLFVDALRSSFQKLTGYQPKGRCVEGLRQLTANEVPKWMIDQGKGAYVAFSTIEGQAGYRMPDYACVSPSQKQSVYGAPGLNLCK